MIKDESNLGIYAKPSRKVMKTMALLTLYTGGNLLGPNNKNPLNETKTDKFLKECHSIKGMSAKEMGTSGKKKLSRAKRKHLRNKK